MRAGGLGFRGTKRKGSQLSRMRRAVVLAAVVALAAGCETKGGEWTPVLESTPPSFLERELGEALEEVRLARDNVRSEPAAAEATLDEALHRLEALTEVYLPLYRAKVFVTNAYREQALGDTGAALRDVEAAREAVTEVNRATEGALEPELQQVVEPLADAQLALEGGSDASLYLERAAETLEDLLTRAGLLT